MSHRRFLFVALLCLAALAALPAVLEAQVWCGEIACYIPPRAFCWQTCLTCGANSGIDYPDGTCQYPEEISVSSIGCPCRTAAAPGVKPEKKATAKAATAGEIALARLFTPAASFSCAKP